MNIPYSPITSKTADYIYGLVDQNPKAFADLTSQEIVRSLFGVAATEPSNVDLTESLIRTIGSEREMEARKILMNRQMIGTIWRFTTTHGFIVEINKEPDSAGKNFLRFVLAYVNKTESDEPSSYTVRTLVRYNGEKTTWCSKNVKSVVIDESVPRLLENLRKGIVDEPKETPAQTENKDASPNNKPSETGEVHKEVSTEKTEVKSESVAKSQSSTDETSNNEPKKEEKPAEVKKPVTKEPASAQPPPNVWKYDVSVLSNSTVAQEIIEKFQKKLSELHGMLGDGLDEIEFLKSTKDITQNNFSVEGLSIEADKKSVTCVVRFKDEPKTYNGNIFVKWHESCMDLDPEVIAKIEKEFKENVRNLSFEENKFSKIVADTIGLPVNVSVNEVASNPILPGSVTANIEIDMKAIRILIKNGESVRVLEDEKSVFICTMDDDNPIILENKTDEIVKSVETECIYEATDDIISYKYARDGFVKTIQTKFKKVKKIEPDKEVKQEMNEEKKPVVIMEEGYRFVLSFVKNGDDNKLIFKDVTTEEVVFEITDPDADQIDTNMIYETLVDITDKLIEDITVIKFFDDYIKGVKAIGESSDAEETSEERPSEETPTNEQNSEEEEEPTAKIDLSSTEVQEGYLRGFFNVTQPAYTHLTSYLRKTLEEIGNESYLATKTIPNQTTLVWPDVTFCFVKMKDGDYFRIYAALTNRGLTDHGWIETRNIDGRWFQIGPDIQNTNQQQQRRFNNGYGNNRRRF